ncbi:hypothetical protein GCM10010404_79990 [Nonomuraea africana]
MGVMLPHELSGFLGMLGVPWPNIDEDEIRKDSTAWRVVNAAAAPAGAAADLAVRVTQQVYHGESATALANRWSAVGGDGGHISQAMAAARMAPVALDGTAAVVSAVKVAVGTQAAAGLTYVVQALAFSGAAGVTLATARMFLTRHAIGKVMREGAEGTGKVLAPALSRRVTDPMRRILENLRRPMGPGGRPLAVGPRGGVPMRPTGPRTPAGPRSVQDGMAQMGRRNNRNSGGNSGGGRGGRSWGRRDQTGKFHGEIPSSTRGMTEEQKKQMADDLKKSIKTREAEQERLGYETGHEERIRREKGFLRKLLGD